MKSDNVQKKDNNFKVGNLTIELEDSHLQTPKKRGQRSPRSLLRKATSIFKSAI